MVEAMKSATQMYIVVSQRVSLNEPIAWLPAHPYLVASGAHGRQPHCGAVVSFALPM